MASTRDLTLLATVGRTPLVRIERCLPEAARHARVLVKMEAANPGGSVKDRIAVAIVERAEREGKLKPGGTVVEYTSGNTGIALAMVCAAKGYRCIIIMPQLPAFRERVMICRQFGADVHLTAPAKGFQGLYQYCQTVMEANPNYFLANQFHNEANPEIHYNCTGPEIWEQSGKQVDYFIAGVGTGGTVVGAGRFLTEQNPSCKVIAVEPTESRVLTGQTHTSHSIMGIGAGVPVYFVENEAPGQPLSGESRGNISEFQHASSQEAVEWCKKLARTEGIMCGPSSGAAMKVAADVAMRPESAGKTIVVLSASHGIRYTMHPLWAQVQEEALEALPQAPNLDPFADMLLWKSGN